MDYFSEYRSVIWVIWVVERSVRNGDGIAFICVLFLKKSLEEMGFIRLLRRDDTIATTTITKLVYNTDETKRRASGAVGRPRRIVVG